MNIGFVGLGKLGLPVALTFESKGHTIYAHDVNPDINTYLSEKKIPFKEEGIQPLLDANNINITSVKEVVKNSDIVFCAVQTPHQPIYEGTTKIPDTREDFDYSYLVDAISEIANTAKRLRKKTMLAVISTCLPGTFEREIKLLLNKHIEYVYNPYFIAMGTVMQDVLNPEFVLIGTNSKDTANKLYEFYNTIHHKDAYHTDITTAEGIKVFYNTFITMKTVLANIYGEMAEKLGMNVDDIYGALSLATDRIISNKYLKSGVGDGGGCHPRDNIALSWLAKKVKLSHNIFEDLMKAREDHMDWLARMAATYKSTYNMPLVLLGRSFKPETNIETGSPAILMSNILTEHGIEHKHVEDWDFMVPAIYFIATKHDKYKEYDFPYGSIVIDPFRYIPEREGVLLISIGAGATL